MTPRSATVTALARGLWAGGDLSAPEEAAAVALQVCVHLRAGLSRWVGLEGYRVLLLRALDLARAEHPVLTQLSCNGNEEQEIAAAVRAHGAAEVRSAMMALIATLIDLLGRIIGEDIAVELVKQAVVASPGKAPVTGTQGERHG